MRYKGTVLHFISCALAAPLAAASAGQNDLPHCSAAVRVIHVATDRWSSRINATADDRRFDIALSYLEEAHPEMVQALKEAREGLTAEKRAAIAQALAEVEPERKAEILASAGFSPAQSQALIRSVCRDQTELVNRLRIDPHTHGARLNPGERSFANDVHGRRPTDGTIPDLSVYKFDIDSYSGTLWANYDLLNQYTIVVEKEGKAVSMRVSRIRDEVITANGGHFLVADIDHGTGRFVVTRVPVEDVKAIHRGDITHIEDVRFIRKWDRALDPPLEKFAIRRDTEITLTFRPHGPGDPPELSRVPHGHRITVQDPKTGKLTQGRFRGIANETGEIYIEGSPSVLLRPDVFSVSSMGRRNFILGDVSDSRFFDAASSEVPVVVSSGSRAWDEAKVVIDRYGIALIDKSGRRSLSAGAMQHTNIAPLLPCDPAKIIEVSRSHSTAIPIFYKSGGQWIADEVKAVQRSKVILASGAEYPRDDFMKLELRSGTLGVVTDVKGGTGPKQFADIHALDLNKPADRKIVAAFTESQGISRPSDREHALLLLAAQWPKKDVKGAILSALANEREEDVRLALLKVLGPKVKGDDAVRKAVARAAMTDPNEHNRRAALNFLVKHAKSEKETRAAFKHVILHDASADNIQRAALFLEVEEIVGLLKKNPERVGIFLSAAAKRTGGELRFLSDLKDEGISKTIDVLKNFVAKNPEIEELFISEMKAAIQSPQVSRYIDALKPVIDHPNVQLAVADVANKHRNPFVVLSAVEVLGPKLTATSNVAQADIVFLFQKAAGDLRGHYDFYSRVFDLISAGHMVSNSRITESISALLRTGNNSVRIAIMEKLKDHRALRTEPSIRAALAYVAAAQVRYPEIGGRAKDLLKP